MTTYQQLAASSDGRPFIVAHRGAWGPAPENSLAAIDEAVARGYEVAEIDVRISSDGVPVVMHDPTFERTTGWTAACNAMPRRTIAKLRLLEGHGGPEAVQSDERVPLLSEMLEHARDRIFLDIDVKDPAAGDAACKAVEDASMGPQVDIKLPFRPGEPASAMHARNDRCGIGRMVMARFAGADWRAAVEGVVALRPFLVETEFDTLERLASVADILRADGIALWVNTLDGTASAGLSDSAALDDPGAVWGRLVEAGVSFIQTDQPTALAAYRGRNGRAA